MPAKSFSPNCVLICNMDKPYDAHVPITCSEASQLLPPFFDGELEGQRVRAVGLHIAQCERCRQEISSLATLQRLLVDTIEACLEEVDPARVWQEVVQRMEHVPPPWSLRLHSWWEEVKLRRGTWPVWVGAVALLLGALFWWGNKELREPLRVAEPNRIQVRSLSTSMPAIAMWSEPDRGTTVIWVADDQPERRGAP